MSTHRPVLLAAALLVHVPFLAQGDGSEDHPVVATNFQWTPQNLTIPPGDTVTFSSAAGTHTFVSDAGDGVVCNPLPCTRPYPAPGRYDFHCGIHPTMRGTVSVGVPPEVSILSPVAGESLAGTVTLAGSATHASEAVKGVQLRVDGVLVASAVPAPDGSWSAAWDTTLAGNGPRTLVARALTASDLAAEASVDVTLANPPTVDLRALRLAGGPAGLAGATLTYTLDNAGNAPTGAFAVAFEYLYKGTWRPVGGFAHSGLAPFSQESGSFEWDAGLHIGRYAVRVVLDPAGLVAEASEANNVAEGTASWFTSSVNGVDPLDP